MPSALSSPRGRPSPLPDLGERSAFVTGQRVGRGRRRRGRRRRLVAPAIAALVIAVPLGAGLGARWLLTTPRFAVARVEVRGTSRVAPADVLAAAAIAPGTSLFRLAADEVAGRVAALPEIRRADVVREFPDRVVISVEERRPFTLVHAGRLHWLDEEGHLLGAAPRAVAAPAPVVSGLGAEEIARLRSAPGPKTRVAIALIKTLLRAGSALGAEVSEIDMSRADGPVLYTVDGIEVRLGDQDWEARLARLEGVLAQVASEEVRVVDLRFRDQVVVQRGGAR